MAAKVIIMDCTIEYALRSGKEKELDSKLGDSVLKEFEKMVDGNFILVHYVVLSDKETK
jgi:hypothetical protein